MKYVFLRIAILILGIIVIHYISDYIQHHAVVEDGGYNFEGVIWFFRLLLGFAIISLGIFSFEAFQFHKQNKIKQRNASLVLIGIIVVLVLSFGGYFLEFAI